ncbi:RluA family pseudouridine synthase [Bacillota bacterium]
MIIIRIGENEKDQRLDRFLRKYYRNAPLSFVYKLLRTAVKLNGKRADQNTKLNLGDELTIDIPESEEKLYLTRERPKTGNRQFKIAYEDDNILVVEKPFGLLTHGSRDEQTETLANQVTGYLTDTGAYRPEEERTFVPSPVNRLDRNTTGLVIFGKNAAALRCLSEMLRGRGYVRRFYAAILHGEMKEPMLLVDRMQKDKAANKILIKKEDTDTGKLIETSVRPLKIAKGFTFAEAELLTGRSHQIRGQLAAAGYPILGDRKYFKPGPHAIGKMKAVAGAQYLHAERLVFEDCLPPLTYLKGKEIRCGLPAGMKDAEASLFR